MFFFCIQTKFYIFVTVLNTIAFFLPLKQIKKWCKVLKLLFDVIEFSLIPSYRILSYLKNKAIFSTKLPDIVSFLGTVNVS